MLSDSTVTDVKLGLTLTRHWRTFINLLIWMMAQVRILNFMKHRLRQDAQLSGFVANDEKSQWVPVQSGELLGDVLNLQMGTLQVLQKRVDAFLHVLQDVLATVLFFYLEGSTLYSAPGFYKFGTGSSSTPVGTEFIS